MGFLRDVENMPTMYDYSLEFFRRYYRPEYTTIVVTGDVKHEQVLPLVKKYWGTWTRGTYAPKIPAEPEQTAERKAHVDWPSPTLPWVAVAYKSPAFSTENKDKVSLDLIGSLGFSPTSDLYQKLVIREQKVDVLFYDSDDHIDPYLVVAAARVKDPKDIEYVRNEILKTFDSFKNTKVSKEKLEAVKSNIKYSFALSLDNSEAIAANVAPYIALTRTPDSINKLFDLYTVVTPEEIQQRAGKYLTDKRRTIVTLAHKERSQDAAK
jgi:zinc protease